ncbi:hypothetical protein BCR33DRAFT_338117 [Rhizoclosmatium globosum]|uniref:BZIP domain-containing protein n=1 Tax=Rhizoclosmatium globosum TaxID=329046 RepID=A0A1Y2C3U5_9FUNG|nr:hypothetical protein BCR33DRAFT_338117 [Rhizoclosmatium globosum]|eukprot:ORY41699.1 hypothetical protein BCR33DRAFT_338117 [Rhizoclosmatium globosum]
MDNTIYATSASPDTTTKQRGRPGRKLASDDSAASKRIQQCRSAQRAFRERKAKQAEEQQLRIQELSSLLSFSQQEVSELRQRVAELEYENAQLRDGLSIGKASLQHPIEAKPLPSPCYQGFWDTCL